MSDAIDTDSEPGLPPPRETHRFFGHQAAEAELAEAMSGGRGHHAWLISGPKGIGKATLAYRFARRLLGARASGPRPLDVAPEDRVAQRIAALTHPDLVVLRRALNDRGKPKREIAVDDARALTAFFNLKPAEGGWRVAIVDSADDLNRNAANALLKTLEEPPPKVALILIAHAPGGLLPTIRSRCRRLRLRPTEDAAVVEALSAAGHASDPLLIRLADGRPGRALMLAAGDGGAEQASFLDAVARAPRDGGAALTALAFQGGGGDGQARLARFLDAAQDWCRRAALQGAGLADAADDGRTQTVMARLSGPERAPAWAEAYLRLGNLRADMEELPLDPSHGYARAAAILAETVRAG